MTEQPLDKAQKRAYATAFKEKKRVGGIHLLHNQRTNKMMLLTTPNLEGAENRFSFARKTSTSPHPRIKDWGDGSGFTITLLDRLELEDDWDARRTKEELKALEELWQEKYPNQEWY